MEIFAQILGYVGMALIVSSFIFKNVKTIRLVNIAGSLLSGAFALILILVNKNTEQLPTLILNLSLIVVNSIMLITTLKNNKKKKDD